MNTEISNGTNESHFPSLSFNSKLHNLILLADSALPLGSFAYSSGLESYLAHHRTHSNPLALFDQFLQLSVQTVAHTNLPFVLAGYRDPNTLLQLDNDLDASTVCTVARRASVAQGKALLSVWEKAFKQKANFGSAAEALNAFSHELKLSAITPTASINGHLAPLWGVVCSSLELPIVDVSYIFLLNHAKAVISAGVRASVMGPYQAQAFLASHELQDMIETNLERVWNISPDDASQTAPIVDLWMGRHELLYSRIFNS